MRRVAIVLAVVLTALVAPARAVASAPNPESAEADFVARINQLRSGKGIGRLDVDGGLVTMARRWAGRMAAADRISHNPNLSRDAPAQWQKVGENVGVGMTVGGLHDAFVASPSHYRNLVDPDFTRIGVGVVIGRDGAIFTAHEFMQPRGAATAAKRAPSTSAARAPSSTAAPPPTPATTVPPPPVAKPVALPDLPAPRLMRMLVALHLLDAR